MDVCVLTGVESEGGVSLARMLVENGFRVYALTAEQQDWGFFHSDFIPLACPHEDRAQAEAILQAILEHEKTIAAVVHLARSFSSQAFLDSSPEQLESLVFRNLTLPLLVNRILLPGVILAKGHLVQCCLPVGRGPRVGGTLYLALEDGLQRFYRRLYEEVRSKGVRVTCVRPFGVLGNGHEQETGVITGEFLAEAITRVVIQQGGGFFSDLEIRPEPVDTTTPGVRPLQAVNLASMRLPPALEKDNHKKSFTLPARKSMAPKKKLQWADRPIDYGPAPELDDEDDEDEEEWGVSHKERRAPAREESRPQPRQPEQKKHEKETPVVEASPVAQTDDVPEQEGDSDGRKRRRRRRRRGRRREDERGEVNTESPANRENNTPVSVETPSVPVQKSSEPRVQPSVQREHSHPEQEHREFSGQERFRHRSGRNRRRRGGPRTDAPSQAGLPSSAPVTEAPPAPPPPAPKEAPVKQPVVEKKPQVSAPVETAANTEKAAAPKKRVVKKKVPVEGEAKKETAEKKPVAKKRSPRKKAEPSSEQE